MFAIPPDLLPHPATLSHYKEVLMGNFPAYIRNSMLVTFFSCAISLALGIPAAYGFAKYATEKTKPVFAAVTAVRMVPPVAMVIPFFLIIRNIHLSDTLLGLIITYIPFELTLIIWMLKNFFGQIPREVEEATSNEYVSQSSLLSIHSTIIWYTTSSPKSVSYRPSFLASDFDKNVTLFTFFKK